MGRAVIERSVLQSESIVGIARIRSGVPAARFLALRWIARSVARWRLACGLQGATVSNRRRSAASNCRRSAASNCRSLTVDYSGRFLRHENRVVPFVALVIVLRQVVPLRLGFENLKTGVTRQGAQTVGIHPPAIDRKTMLGPARWNDDAANAIWLERACDLPRCFPEEFRV